MNAICLPLNRLSIAGLLCLLSAMMPPPVVAAEVTQVEQNKLSVSVQHTDIAEVYEMLSRHAQANILLSSGVSGDVSVNLYDVSLEEAIMSVAAAGGYAVQRRNSTYIISKHDDAGKDIAGGLTIVRAFKVQYTPPKDIEEILKKHLSRYGKVTTLEEQKMLVVEDLPDFVAQLEQLIQQLDRQPTQILIEAKILEISLTDTEAYGIDWTKFFKSSGGTGSFGTQGLSAPGAPGLFFSFINDNISIGLDALSSKGRVRTLSTPKLLTLEHQEAEVIIGDRLGYKVTTTINQVTSESIAFIESGVILKVTTFVDQAGQIMMDIHPEVSTGTVTDGIPSIATTEVSTQLLAEDGQTVFIGGLIKNSLSESRNGVPILGDLPVLGRLFSNTNDLSIDTETIVLITPRIIRTPMDMFNISDTPRVDKVDTALQKEAIDINRKFEPREPVEEVGNNPQTNSDSGHCEQRGPSFITSGNCSPVATDMTSGATLFGLFSSDKDEVQ